MKVFKPLFFSSIIFFNIGCGENKDKSPTPNDHPNSNVKIEVSHIANAKIIELETEDYTTPIGVPYQIKDIKYFLSNFSFIKPDGTKYTVPQDESYFLIKEKNEETKTLSFEIPEGEYSHIEFMLGVDSLRNTMNISERQGVLDPTGNAQGMYWTWNSGYIHLIFEGSSREIPVDLISSQVFQYHIGGFGGYSSPTPNNTRVIRLDLNSNGRLLANSNSNASIDLEVDFDKFFNAEHTIDIRETPLLMNDSEGTMMADNAKMMFRHKLTTNNE